MYVCTVCMYAVEEGINISPYSNGSLYFVHVLPARSTRSHGRDLHVLREDSVVVAAAVVVVVVVIVV